MKAFDDLLMLLCMALNSHDLTEKDLREHIKAVDESGGDWDSILKLAEKNSVGGLLYELLAGYAEIPKKQLTGLEKYSRKICRCNYRYLVASVQIKKAFEKAGIPFCIMKGAAAAADYPVPDVRKAGDVDILLLRPADLEQALGEIERLGFAKEEEQHSLHHVGMKHPDGCEIEVHTMFAEPFDNRKINKYLEQLVPESGKHIIYKEIMGAELPVLEDAYHAYELLLHMLQHFLRKGFGIKLLCDWVTLWNRGLSDSETDTYLRLVTESGIKGFSDVITRTCVKYLGLKRDNVTKMRLYDSGKKREELEKETAAFLDELKDAGEFGESRERMVALRGNGMTDYIREFHHQMHLNFPKAGKCFLFWPVLWVITLVRFLRNNRRVRAVSGRELLKSAGQRGKLVKEMRLFETEQKNV